MRVGEEAGRTWEELGEESTGISILSEKIYFQRKLKTKK